jgi:uncharacterized protein (DUF1697 family)
MVYVALLRGINVGGNAKVEMAKLKTLFESLGCKDVSTYINSGNVIFRDSRKPVALIEIIEKAIKDTFGFDVRVIIRVKDEINKLCKVIPLSWTNDDKQKTDVMLLWNEINDIEIIDKISINPEIENVLYFDGALVWNIDRKNVTKGGGVKIIKTDLYKHMTVRNINTIRKLNDLMNKTIV